MVWEASYLYHGNPCIWKEGLYIEICPCWPVIELLKKAVTVHYNYVIMSAVASQITSASIVCSTLGSGPGQGKHQSSTSKITTELEFVFAVREKSGNFFLPILWQPCNIVTQHNSILEKKYKWKMFSCISVRAAILRSRMTASTTRQTRCIARQTGSPCPPTPADWHSCK